jgi:hypothetical protein
LYLGPYITSVVIGDATVDVDGQKMQLQAAPYVDSGDTWIPCAFSSSRWLPGECRLGSNSKSTS